MATISKTDLENAKLDVDDLASFVSDEAGTVTPRIGDPYPNARQLVENFNEVLAEQVVQEEIATAQAAIAVAAAADAEAVAGALGDEIPGDPSRGYAFEDKTDYFRFTPDTLEHPVTDDLAARVYALEIATKRETKWNSLKSSGSIIAFVYAGQSRSRGQQSTYGKSDRVFSGTSMPATLGVMFNGGIRPDDLTTNMATAMASFTAMIETYVAASADPTAAYGYQNGETGLAGAIEMIAQLLRDENGIDLATYAQRYLGYSVGRGGTAINDLIPTNDTYGRHALLKTGITNARTIATSSKKIVQMGAIFFAQGEADYAVTPATWATKARAIRTDAETHAQTQFGDTRPMPMIIEQISSHPSCPLPASGFALAVAQAAMAFSDDYINCLPSHMIQRNPGGDVHDMGQSSYEKGAFFGWLWKRWCFDGVKILPFVPTVQVQGKIVVFSWPDIGNRKLALDTTYVPLQTNYGLTIENGAGTAQTINNVWIDGQNFYAELASTPAAGWKYQFGKQSSTGYLGLCNITDDTPIILKKTQRPIRRYVPNWEGVLL